MKSLLIKSIKIPLKRTLCSKLEEIEKFMHESVEIAYATNDPTVKLTLDLFRGWDFENSLIKNFVYDTRYPRE